MKPRERILAIAVAALVGVLGLRAALTLLNDSFDERERRLDGAQQALQEKQADVQKGAVAMRSLKGWRERSLPSDRSVAKSLYQKWLLEIARTSGLHQVNILAESVRQPIDVRRGPGAMPPYEQIGFRIDAQGELSQIVRLLHQFHSANHLQRVAAMSIEPVNSRGELSLAMKIEALIMLGTTRTDSLNQDKSDRLAFGDLAAYEKAIVGRNLFAEYQPPPPPVTERREEVVRRPPPPPAFDQAKHATVTGIVEQGNQPQLWIYVKTTGELLKVAEGEEFSVGELKCKVVRINLRDAELTTGERRFVVKLQDNLRDAATTKSGEL